ncbi:hypothetical protein R80B4_01416 [Fibrobacteres bacterium R8-0-B4]
MITLHEAYLKAKSDAEKYGHKRLAGCRDYGEFWGFCFVPPLDEKLLKELNGGCDTTVNKKTGKIGYFNVIMDFDLFEKSIPLPVEQFDEYSIAV